MRKAFFWILKILVALAAMANLVALFIFEYQFPESWNLPFGYRQTAETELTLAANEPDTEVQDQDQTQAQDQTQTQTSAEGIRLEVPAAPVSYNGSGRLDLMSNVYVVNPDGTSATGLEVTTSISAGSSRREKIITYSVVTPGGETLTAQRILSLGTRYTGPSINILGKMPYCAEGEAGSYAAKLIEQGLISAEDGFDNSITTQVTSRLKRYDSSQEEAEITLLVTNIFSDTYTTDVIVPMNATGIVLTLTSETASVAYGETFSALPYVDQCYDAEGNDLTDRVVREGDVDSYTPGEYPVTVYCTDSEGTRSITRSMVVTVQEAPPEEDQEGDGE